MNKLLRFGLSIFLIQTAFLSQNTQAGFLDYFRSQEARATRGKTAVIEKDITSNLTQIQTEAKSQGKDEQTRKLYNTVVGWIEDINLAQRMGRIDRSEAISLGSNLDRARKILKNKHILLTNNFPNGSPSSTRRLRKAITVAAKEIVSPDPALGTIKEIEGYGGMDNFVDALQGIRKLENLEKAVSAR